MAPGFLDSLGGWVLGRLGAGEDPEAPGAGADLPSLPLPPGWDRAEVALLSRRRTDEGEELLVGLRERGVRGERLVLAVEPWEDGEEWALGPGGLSETRCRGALLPPLPAGAAPAPELAAGVLELFRALRLEPGAPLPSAGLAPALRTRETFWRDAYPAAGLRRRVELIGEARLVLPSDAPPEPTGARLLVLEAELLDRLEDGEGALVAGGAERPRRVQEHWWLAPPGEELEVLWIESPALTPEFPPPRRARPRVVGVTHPEEEDFASRALDARSTRLSAMLRPGARREVLERRPADVAELRESGRRPPPPFLAGDFTGLAGLEPPLPGVALLETVRALHRALHRARAGEEEALADRATPELLRSLGSEEVPLLEAARPEAFLLARVWAAALRSVEPDPGGAGLRLTLALEALVGHRVGEREEVHEVSETLTLVGDPGELATGGVRALRLGGIQRTRRGPAPLMDLWRGAGALPPPGPEVSLEVDRALDRLVEGPAGIAWEELAARGRERAEALLVADAGDDVETLAALSTPEQARLLEGLVAARSERGLSVHQRELAVGAPLPVAVDAHPSEPAIALWIPARAQRELRTAEGERVAGSALAPLHRALVLTLVRDPEGDWRVAELVPG